MPFTSRDGLSAPDTRDFRKLADLQCGGQFLVGAIVIFHSVLQDQRGILLVDGWSFRLTFAFNSPYTAARAGR